MLGLIPILFCGNMVSEGAARQSAGEGAGRDFILNSYFESFNSISDFGSVQYTASDFGMSCNVP